MQIAFLNDYDTITKAIRWVASAIDFGIYWLVSLATDLMFNIANVTVTTEFVTSFISRLYIVAAIYMLFKLAISLLNGIVSPDSLTDKQAGMQKIVPRVLISIMLLIFLPTLIFPNLIEWQNTVAAIIPTVILGTDGKVDSELGSETSIGNYIASSTLGAFAQPGSECVDSSGNGVEAAPNNLKGITAAVQERCPVDRSVFAYEYTFFISGIVGIIMLLVMVSFCIDISIRTLKLCILQVVAPIPIISYIDPKSAKDGAFAAWSKNFISTYLELFIKMSIVYFMIFCVKQLFSSDSNVFDFGTLSIGSNIMVKIFLILGVLLFARGATKFISDILGIKGGTGSIGLGGLLAGTAALVGGAGLAGAGAAALGSLNAGADALAQGKQAPGGWGAGRDLAAQIRTGDKNAKGGVLNNLARSAQSAANRNVLKRVGVTDDSLGKSKSNMINAKVEEANAKRIYDESAADSSVSQSIKDNNYADWQEKSTASSIASSNYEKANKEYDSRGLSTSFIDKNKPKVFQKDPNYRTEKASYKALRNDANKDAIGKAARGDFKGAKDELQAAATLKKEMQEQHIINKGGYDPNKRS